MAINPVLLGMGMLAKTTNIPSPEAAEPTSTPSAGSREGDRRRHHIYDARVRLR